MRYGFIASYRRRFSVSAMCRVLGVSRSGYYAWRERAPSNRSRANAELVRAIRRVHARSSETYGSPRVHRALCAGGLMCGRNRVARLMRVTDIRAKQVKHYRRNSYRSSGLPAAPNLLGRHFGVDSPNRVWVSDITYIATRSGWGYLAVVLDLYSRRVVGWSFRSSMGDQLTLEALRRAYVCRQPSAGLLHHSDQGVQYTSVAYQARLASQGMEVSMSRRGNCWDNAVAESFFHTLKTELVNWKRYKTHEEAATDLCEYIEAWYNKERLHSSLGYRSPADYEAQEIAVNNVY